ncbi:MAG: N-acetylmuramoyl-L-alanine amidase [Dysgonamonadaceae bacterium]|jgi:N-acetylmuramoyl-L-alanine amidase|nr:N-acetylmuramoyl-L-alanine amidase [Dysgonamonadaceae bacterium]
MCRYGYLILFLPLFYFFSQSIVAEPLSRNAKFTVVIDAGHGGKDPGALGATAKEKDITLKVAKKLGALIEENYDDVRVIYTRKSDVFVELNQRAQIANNAHADLFISLHCNALSKKQRSPQGVETFVLGLHRSKDNLDVAKAENAVILYEKDYSTKYQGFNPNEPESYIIFEFMTNKFLDQSVQLATWVQHSLVRNSKRVNRSVRQAGFLVLREVAMPSILIELGYISNKEDETFLKSASGQSSMANSIYKAFSAYKADYDKKSGLIVSANKREEVLLDETPEESTPATATSESIAAGNSEYRIQFLASPRKYGSKASAFKGLSPVDYYKDGSTYKYTYGSTSDKNEALRLLKKAQRNFKDAFIVEFRDGKRIR